MSKIQYKKGLNLNVYSVVRRYSIRTHCQVDGHTFVLGKPLLQTETGHVLFQVTQGQQPASKQKGLSRADQAVKGLVKECGIQYTEGSTTGSDKNMG